MAPYLRAGGTLAIAEPIWLSNDPPEEIRAFWNTNYPEMCHSRDHCDVILRAGDGLVEAFALPKSDRWDHDEGDLEARIKSFAGGFEGADPEIAEAVVQRSRTEIDILRHSYGSYGYVFYISRKPN